MLYILGTNQHLENKKIAKSVHITETEQNCSDANQTRTQPQRMSLSHPGKAKDIRSTILLLLRRHILAIIQ